MLGTLSLRWCSGLERVDDVAGCSRLHTLDLAYCRSVRAIAPLLRCPALVSLDLTGCEELVDRAYYMTRVSTSVDVCT
jgi:hypothetical protein